MELLVFAAVMLVIMPALIYLIGWAALRYTDKARGKRGSAVAPKLPVRPPGGGLAAGATE